MIEYELSVIKLSFKIDVQIIIRIISLNLDRWKDESNHDLLSKLPLYKKWVFRIVWSYSLNWGEFISVGVSKFPIEKSIPTVACCILQKHNMRVINSRAFLMLITDLLLFKSNSIHHLFSTFMFVPLHRIINYSASASWVFK